MIPWCEVFHFEWIWWGNQRGTYTPKDQNSKFLLLCCLKRVYWPSFITEREFRVILCQRNNVKWLGLLLNNRYLESEWAPNSYLFWLVPFSPSIYISSCSTNLTQMYLFYFIGQPFCYPHKVRDLSFTKVHLVFCKSVQLRLGKHVRCQWREIWQWSHRIQSVCRGWGVCAIVLSAWYYI